MPSVALIDDDSAFRRAIERLIRTRGDDHACVGSWSTVEAALPALAAAAPQVLLLDIDLPGLPGHAALPQLLAALPALAVVMLTAHDDNELIFAALQAGAVGYLLKSAEPDEILTAIDDAAAGGAPMSPVIARKVVGFFATRRVPPPTPARIRDPEVAGLTEREEELLALIARGETDKAAADRLGVSHGTVRNRLHGIYRKLQVSSRTEAAARYRNS